MWASYGFECYYDSTLRVQKDSITLLIIASVLELHSLTRLHFKYSFLGRSQRHLTVRQGLELVRGLRRSRGSRGCQILLPEAAGIHQTEPGLPGWKNRPGNEALFQAKLLGIRSAR